MYGEFCRISRQIVQFRLVSSNDPIVREIYVSILQDFGLSSSRVGWVYPQHKELIDPWHVESAKKVDWNFTPENLHEPRKNPFTLHYTGWLIGILILVYANRSLTR